MAHGVVLGTYTAGGTGRLVNYLMSDARDLAIATYENQPVPKTLDRIRALANNLSAPLAIHFAISLNESEQLRPAELVELNTEILTRLQTGSRPFISPVHGPPKDLHHHIHTALALRDEKTGELFNYRGLARQLHDILTTIAADHNLEPPPIGEPSRRRTPRRARSVGVWHGERSRYEWLAERVGDDLIEGIARAETWRDVAAQLAEYGLSYGRSARGGVIIDHSGERPSGIAASGLAWSCSLPQMEARLGPLPDMPAPADARANPRAYTNDHDGRRNDLGTDAERRAFLDAHTSYRLVWKPVRAARLAEQGQREAERRSEIRAEVALMRQAKAATATNIAERDFADRVIAAYERQRRREAHDVAVMERAALRALPYGAPPPARLREFIEAQAPPPDERRLCGTAAPPLAPGLEFGGLRTEPGLLGTDIWCATHRVAVDYGDRLAIADASAVPDLLTIAAERWRSTDIGGDDAFRDYAERQARRAGLATTRLPFPEAPAPLPVVEVPSVRAIRRAAAIAHHLDRDVALDGHLLERDAPERHPRASQPEDESAGRIGLRSPAIVLEAEKTAMITNLRETGLAPNVRSGKSLVYLVDPSATREEVQSIEETLMRTYGLKARRTFPIAEPLEYGPREVLPLIRDLLARLRPPAEPMITYQERLAQLDTWFRDRTAAPAWLPEAPTPVLTAPPKPGRRRTR